LILAISTSLSQFTVAINRNGKLVYHKQADRALSGHTGIYELVVEALESVQTTTVDIEGIVVDTGPGGTSSVRTGVSFANGLSYSLDVPIVGISSAEIMGIEAFQKYQIPVISLFKSIKGNYYCGFYDGKKLEFQFTNLDNISAYINEEFTDIALAGHTEGMTKLANLLTINKIISNIHKVNALTLGENAPALLANSNKYPILPIPLTETDIPRTDDFSRQET